MFKSNVFPSDLSRQAVPFTVAVQPPWNSCRQSVTVSVARYTCWRPMTWDAHVPPQWRVDSRPTSTAERGRAKTCARAPTVWSRVFGLHRQPMKLSEHWKRCGHVDEFQWRAVLPRSVPTAAVGSDRQRCHTAVRYSSLVGMTRMTKLASSWHRPTTNAQSFVHCSRPSDRLQWRGQTSLIQCQWPVPLYIVSVSFLWGDLRASDLKVECKAFLDIGAFFPIMSLLT